MRLNVDFEGFEKYKILDANLSLLLNHSTPQKTLERTDTVQDFQGVMRSLKITLFLALYISSMLLAQVGMMINFVGLEA